MTGSRLSPEVPGTAGVASKVTARYASVTVDCQVVTAGSRKIGSCLDGAPLRRTYMYIVSKRNSIVLRHPDRCCGDVAAFLPPTYRDPEIPRSICRAYARSGSPWAPRRTQLHPRCSGRGLQIVRPTSGAGWVSRRGPNSPVSPPEPHARGIYRDNRAGTLLSGVR